MKHEIKAGLICVHEGGSETFHLEGEGAKIYDENNNCVECMSYFYDPHEPDCKYSDNWSVDYRA